MRGLLLGALLLGLPPSIHAERFETFGDYRIHYNAFPSALLTAEAAGEHRLMRSRLRGVLTISVFERGAAVPARIAATATNSAGEVERISLKEFRRNGSIYQIGNVAAGDGERLRFRVEVLPQGAAAPVSWRFSQQFFVD